MDQRQASNSKSHKNTDDIFVKELQKLQSSVGFSENIHGLKKQEPVMSGHFCCHTFQDGLSMHATKAVERQDTSNAMELPSGLSFNFVFRGEIAFNFGNNHYLMKGGDNIQCTAIVNNSPELMTRFMQQDMLIHKLNIFVEENWLAARCKSPEDIEMLRSIFSAKSVYTWEPDARTIEKAKQLIRIEQASDFTAQLEVEYLTIQLLNACISGLYRQASVLSTANKTPLFQNSQLKKEIDQQLERFQSVADIADALNMSERTLQRKFQACYQTSASSYIKQRKLEKAKKALIFDGKSIGEVAYMTGYNHSSNFTNAFKKQFGATPTDYIKLHKISTH